MTKYVRIHRKDMCSEVITKQLYRSTTSIGANYAEAKSSESMKDFIHKIYLCRKEALESKYWLELLIETNDSCKNHGLILLQEIHEIVLILSKMISTSQSRKVR